MNRTAVVFGSTGLVGRALIDELLNGEDFSKVVAVSRRELPMVHRKLEQVIISDFSKLIKEKEKLDASVYFCCIGTTIKNAGTKEAFRKVDLDIPRYIASLAETLSVGYLAVISSLGADSLSSNFYLRTKGEMEHAVRKEYMGNLKIVRPSLLLGNRDEFRFGEKTASIFMKVLGWIFIGSLKRYRGIQVRDVAKAMIRITQYPTEKVVYESDELLSIIA